MGNRIGIQLGTPCWNGSPGRSPLKGKTGVRVSVPFHPSPCGDASAGTGRMLPTPLRCRGQCREGYLLFGNIVITVNWE